MKIQSSILATKDFLLWVLTLGFILCVKPPWESHEMTLVLGSICFEAQFGCFWRTWMKSQNLPVLLWVSEWLFLQNERCNLMQPDPFLSLHYPGPVKKAKINSTGPDSDVGTLSFSGWNTSPTKFGGHDLWGNSSWCVSCLFNLSCILFWI